MAKPDDPLFGKQEALRCCGFDKAWSATAGSTSHVKVALVDSGVDLAHPDLPDVRFNSFQYELLDGSGHGTCVAGILGAIPNNQRGIAGAVQCEIEVYRVFDDAGRLDVPTYHRALEMIADSNANVVNISLGGLAADARERMLIDACVVSGKTVLAAMGNVPEFRQRSVVFPAALDSVIAVGATNGAGRREDYSLAGNHVWISAPGTSIWATTRGGGYREVTGTSFATPLVTAACVLLHRQNPQISPQAVGERLKRLVRPEDEARGWNPDTGHGQLDVGRLAEMG